MFGLFLKFGCGIPSARDIKCRLSADGRRIAPLWVRYESPVTNPPHERPSIRLALNNIGATGERRVRHVSGAVYTFGPWLPARRIPRVQGERTPMLRLPGPGLSNIEEDRTSRIIQFGLGEALQYSYIRDYRFAILTSIMLGLGLWFIIVPEPLALQPAVLSSEDLGLFFKVAKNTFRDGVCSNHPHLPSPCECGEPLNTTLKDILYLDDKPFDPLKTSIHSCEPAFSISGFDTVRCDLTRYSFPKYGIVLTCKIENEAKL